VAPIRVLKITVPADTTSVYGTFAELGEAPYECQLYGASASGVHVVDSSTDEGAGFSLSPVYTGGAEVYLKIANSENFSQDYYFALVPIAPGAPAPQSYTVNY